MIRRQFSNRRVRVFVGLMLLAGLLIQCQRALESRSGESASPVAVRGPAPSGPSVALAAPTADTEPIGETIEQRAARDPVAFLENCLERYDRSVRDYTCTFTKQELVGRKLTEVQVMRAWCREDPFSVRLEWTENADKCDKVLYVKDRWIEDGKQKAVVVPGRIARLFVSHVMREIDGKDAKKASRRTVNQFGLRNSMILILKYCKLAAEQDALRYDFMGKGEVDGRETLVFERHLPYTGDEAAWPDRVLVVHVDTELLVPIRCEAYADDAKEALLGTYTYTGIELNPNLPDETFSKKALGID